MEQTRIMIVEKVIVRETLTLKKKVGISCFKEASYINVSPVFVKYNTRKRVHFQQFVHGCQYNEKYNCIYKM